MVCDMFQTRIHGRGGQGVVTAAEVLSIAAFLEGRHAQAFPSFGSERMGAPVTAFCRIDDKEIRLREPISRPDALIIQDPTLLHQVEMFSGVDTNGYLLINTSRSVEQLGIGELAARFPAGHVRTIAASEIAVKYVGRPLPNAALLGAFAAVTGQIGVKSVQAAITEKFGGEMGRKNREAAAEAYAAARAA